MPIDAVYCCGTTQKPSCNGGGGALGRVTAATAPLAAAAVETASLLTFSNLCMCMRL